MNCFFHIHFPYSGSLQDRLFDPGFRFEQKDHGYQSGSRSGSLLYIHKKSLDRKIYPAIEKYGLYSHHFLFLSYGCLHNY